MAQGAAGLKFTPTTGSLATGSFNVEESTTNVVSGLSGATVAATINVTLAGPSVTGAITTENTQTAFGLVITPGANDSTAAYFQITGITGGTLYQNNGTTPISNGSFITVAQGEAGLKFTPTTDSLATGSFVVQESTTNVVSGLSGPTATATITVALAAPVVTPSGTTNTFVIGGAAVAVDAGVTVTSDDTDLTGATVTINNFQSGDKLNFTNQNGISGSYAGGLLTLSGSATPAQYQTALQSVTFSTTSTNTATRSISIVALDANDTGGVPSNTAAETVKVAAAAPVVIPSGTTNTFTVGGSAVAVDSGVTVTSVDADLTGATVTINNFQSGDKLNFTNQNGISGSYATGVLTLSGSATPGQYQTALRSVTFSTTSTDTVTRSISIIALDSSASPTTSNTAAEGVKVTIAAPVVTPSGTTNTFTIGGSAVAVDAGVTVTSVDADLTGATVTINNFQSGDKLNFVNQNGISGSYVTGVLTLSGSATAAQYQTALRSVTFSTTSTDTVTRSISIVAIDSSASPTSSNSAAESVDVVNATLIGPSVTNATTTENKQTAAGLVITRGAGDSTAAYFEITDITGGTLYQNNGTTPITAGSFITLAQGGAGLKFTPNAGSLAAGGFTVQESTTADVTGLSGPTARAAITVTLTGPKATGTTTTENTQSTSGLVITPGTNDSSATHFEITGITGGTLYQHDGTTPITAGTFITLAQGAAGLKFTPTAGSLTAGTFLIQESSTAAAGGLSGATLKATIGVTLAGAKVTGATTTESTQSTSGLVITPGANDTSGAYFQITLITGGTLYQNNGTTPITAGSFITLAQGAAGLKFTPNSGTLVPGGFTIRESTTNATSGLSGPTTRAAIAVTLTGPNVTVAATTENTQSTSGLVITRSANDTSATHFQITGISGGTLYQHDGTTPIASGSFITLAQGAAGLKFTPTTGSLATGSFSVEESSTDTASGLSGATATATIPVTLAGPKFTNATTTEGTQSTSGLVITSGTNDSSAAFFEITNITGGTLYQHDGTTPIASGSFITLAQGAAGLKFTPNPGTLVPGGFTVQESTTSAVGGLNGPAARAVITVTPAGPSVTNATTTENTQTTSGLVITPGLGDSTAAYFQISVITGGTLYQNNGTTPISNGSFITLAQGGAGLKFTPNPGTLVPGGFTVQESTTAAVGGLTGPTARAAITVTLAGPSVTGGTTTEEGVQTSALVITPGSGDSTAAYFQITGITGGTLYQNNGTTPITNGSFITLAQGEAGLKFTPTAGSTSAGGFSVQESTSAAVSGLSGPTSQVSIAVTAASTQAVDLSSYYNLQGITADCTKFSGGGLDGAGNALSEKKVGTSQTWNGVNFTIAPTGANNVVQAEGQTITLPDGSFSTLNLLATAVNGNQPSVTFTVNYTDGTSQTFTQSISDWHTPQSYSGESVVVSSSYRNTEHGTKDCLGPFDVYGYSLTLNSAKTVESITLPADSHVEVLAITVAGLVTTPVESTPGIVSTAKTKLS